MRLRAGCVRFARAAFDFPPDDANLCLVPTSLLHLCGANSVLVLASPHS